MRRGGGEGLGVDRRHRHRGQAPGASLNPKPNFHAMFPSWCSTACLENFITATISIASSELIGIEDELRVLPASLTCLALLCSLSKFLPCDPVSRLSPPSWTKLQLLQYLLKSVKQ